LIHHYSADTVEQVAMVSKTLSEIRIGKELWKIKGNQSMECNIALQW